MTPFHSSWMERFMRCADARQLFDAFLNRELSPSMATELQAHRVKCADCRRELALLEVSGHVLRADRDPVTVDDSFTDRLIACMDEPRSRWPMRLRWTAYVGAPLAAAAVVEAAERRHAKDPAFYSEILFRLSSDRSHLVKSSARRALARIRTA